MITFGVATANCGDNTPARANNAGVQSSSAITAGGSYGTSSHFSMWSTVGDSPGGNFVGKSANFVLQGGVVGRTP